MNQVLIDDAISKCDAALAHLTKPFSDNRGVECHHSIPEGFRVYVDDSGKIYLALLDGNRALRFTLNQREASDLADMLDAALRWKR